MESGVKMVMTMSRMTVLTDEVWYEDGNDYDSTH